MDVYKSTATLCEIYEVSKDFFLRRIQSGEFIANQHFIKQSTTLRWNIQAIEQWWRGKSSFSNEIDDILNRILPD